MPISYKEITRKLQGRAFETFIVATFSQQLPSLRGKRSLNLKTQFIKQSLLQLHTVLYEISKTIPPVSQRISADFLSFSFSSENISLSISLK